ncbi:NAD(P)/FAD-dependent oxidoreductase, partial [Abyssibius alkaniclasticus]|uniref:NAD(P)/FAD-dependent oxidoreductase n=1 Tax=Abyssibius alkaniclasticus TaxID=2881234 RepID=UPI004058DF71
MPANQPSRQNYDVVIIGGGIMGASTAWFLTDTPDFDGTVLVVERDPSYATASTTHTNSCMRQQFSDPLNVQISQFAAAFIKDLRTNMGGDERVPNLSVQNFGYLYLADNEGFADVLRANQKVQLAAGAQTQLLDASALKAAYPFYQLDDIILGSINRKDEGFFDGSTLFDWWRRQSRERGVEYVRGEVVAVNRDAGGQRVASVTLGDGTVLGCGQVVNAAGPRAALVAKMAGLSVPVEPRKRFTWVFKAEQPLDQPLPLTIDPSGVHFRENGGGTYMAGGHGDVDPAVDFDDFAMDFNLWESHVWPVIATRIPQFEAIKVQSEWAGHYAYNTFDQNAIVGP